MKIDKVKIKSKRNFISSVMFFIFLAIILGLRTQGVYFPEKEELQYTTGIFYIEKTAKFTNHVRLNQIDKNGKSMVFSCAYNPFGNGRDSSCGDTKFLQPYVGKQATIGWYQQRDFLWFHNKMPQLVSIEIDNTIKRSYESRKETIHGLKFINILLLIFAALMSYVVYCVDNRIDKKFAKKI